MNVKVKENIKDIAPKDFASKVGYLAGQISTVSNFTENQINLKETGLLSWKYEYFEVPKLNFNNCLSDFTIGMRVRVKEDLKERCNRIGTPCPDDFAKWAGKEGTIIGKTPNGFLTLAEDPKRWTFGPNDLEILEDSKSTNKFKVEEVIKEEKSESSLFIEKVEVISPTYKSPVIELEDLPVLGYFKS